MHWKRYPLSEVISSRDNNFDLLRLIAALLVMFGHSFWIQPAAERHEPILAFTGIEYSGSIAVYTFFLISGMLVSASYDRQRSLWKFIVLRVSRIYPAMFVCVALVAYLLYPILRGISFSDAFHDPLVWRYFSINAEMFRGTIRSLPEIFDHVAIRGAVNPSLWTLSIEMKCYALVAVAGLIGAFRHRLLYLLASIGVLILVWWMLHFNVHSALLDGLQKNANAYTFYPVPFFAFGMGLYAMRRHVTVSWPVALLLVLAYLAAHKTAIGAPLLYLAIAYGALWVSATSRLHRFRPSHDLSYGVYLWGFVIQQTVARTFPHMDNLISLFVSVPFALAAAFLSFMLVERPFIRMARGVVTSIRPSYAIIRQPQS